MKPKHQRALGHYTRWMADEMGLKDWHFDILVTDKVGPGSLDTKGGKDDPDVDGVAMCVPIPGQKKATIFFTHGMKDLKPEHVREIVCHELMHCHLGPMYEWGRIATLDHFSQSAYDIFMFGFAQQWETVVDGVSRAWAEKFPVIDWKLDGPLSETN